MSYKRKFSHISHRKLQVKIAMISLYMQMHKDYIICFKNFKLSPFKFVYDLLWINGFIFILFYCIWYRIVLAPSVEKILFLHLHCFCKIVGSIWMGLFIESLFCSINLSFSLFDNSMCLNYCSFIRVGVN